MAESPPPRPIINLPDFLSKNSENHPCCSVLWQQPSGLAQRSHDDACWPAGQDAAAPAAVTAFRSRPHPSHM
eukprot:3556037-Pleurochrysis_carterae.AAC.1